LIFLGHFASLGQQGQDGALATPVSRKVLRLMQPPTRQFSTATLSSIEIAFTMELFTSIRSLSIKMATKTVTVLF
jgi:hypothetical protein